MPLVTNLISDNVDDLDNDPSTDQYINLVYFDMNANFPGESLPTSLAEITFSTSTQEVDPVTWEPITTAVNFSSSERATGYEFLGESTQLTAQPFNLDVDGNGEVTAFGDGLMILRKMFGTAFASDALTDKAIASDATRTTEEIHEFIQGGIDSGALDVDQDGEVKAFSDGLMVIRHLFGIAFSGAALTDGAIPDGSTYWNDQEPWIAVGNNIDALM